MCKVSTVRSKRRFEVKYARFFSPQVSLQDIYYISQITQAFLSHTSTFKWSARSGKRQISLCKNKFVPLLSGNPALKEAISFDRSISVNIGVKLEGIVKKRNFCLLPSKDSRFAVFSNITTWYGSLKFLSDNLVVSYSPFFSNANKINNKWYVTVRKSGVFISSFSGVRKNAFALQEKKY